MKDMLLGLLFTVVGVASIFGILMLVFGGWDSFSKEFCYANSRTEEQFRNCVGEK